MRITLCATQIPFMRGGAEYLCDNLYSELVKRGYDVEYIRIPFKWYPPEELINNSLIWRLLDLSESNGTKIDVAITTKFPSYLVKHENKVVWLLHQHRVAYDKAYTKFDDLVTHGSRGEIVRKKIHSLDDKFLRDAKSVYTISQNVSDRLQKYNQISGKVLYPPPPFAGRYYSKDYGNYILYPSRIDPLKRQDLVISCMRHIKNDLRLKIVGTGPMLSRYMALAKELKVDDRVDFLGHISEDELLELYANAFCIAYTPSDEDLGDISIESFLSKKPVITCTDSGGPLEFVEDGINGYIAEPTPQKIAEKIDLLYNNGLYEKFGASGYDKVVSLNMSWEHVIEQLLRNVR